MLQVNVQNKTNASELSQAVNRLILRLKFIVTVELLYDPAENDFVPGFCPMSNKNVGLSPQDVQ